MKKGVIKNLISTIVVFLFAILFGINSHESKGQFGDTVPVHDAEVINLLEQLVEKEFKLDPEQRQLAQENLDLASDYILDLLGRMGRKGDADDSGDINVFVQNWRNLALEGQYRGENLWRGLLAVAAEGEGDIPPLLCKHIRESAAFISLQPTKVEGTSILNSGLRRSASSLDDYLTKAACDPFVDENYNILLQNFSGGGGWETWKRLMQPQNNIFGALEMALGERERQVKIENEADSNETLSGSGYLGRRECLSFGPAGQCVIWSNVTIPSDLAAEVLGALLNQNLAFIANTDERGEGFGIEINKIIEAIFGSQ